MPYNIEAHMRKLQYQIDDVSEAIARHEANACTKGLYSVDRLQGSLKAFEMAMRMVINESGYSDTWKVVTLTSEMYGIKYQSPQWNMVK